jgi:NAD(P)-dependent dehydrogenase (short-subunit alcohol dehydrogenase family)
MGPNALPGLDGRGAIVTGAGSGIGQACALALASAGSSVCVVDLDADAALRTVREVESAGGGAIAITGDAREKKTAEEAVRAAQERFGRVDVLVNNVGGTFFAPAQDITLNGWHAVLRLNLDTTLLFSQAVAPLMTAAGKGVIVNVSSITGVTASPNAAHYGAAKAAIISLTRTLAAEWAPAIRVNAVAPEYISTANTDRFISREARLRMLEQTPLGRFGKPDDVASAVLFLASDMASFMTGQTLIIDGGSMLQNRLDFIAGSGAVPES